MSRVRPHMQRCGGGRRFVVALLAAASIHAVALWWQFGRRVSSEGIVESIHRTESLIELESTPLAESPNPRGDLATYSTSELGSTGDPSAARSEAPGHASGQRLVGATAGPLPTAPTKSNVSELESPASLAVVSGIEATKNASSSVATSSTPIDLGLDGRILRPTFRDAQARHRVPRDLGTELQRNLNESIRSKVVAEDARRGRGRGSILLGALSSAVRTSGPPFGEAILSAAFDSSGELNGLTLIRGTAGDWSKAMQAFREQARHKRVPVPTGAKGLRVTFRVATKIQRPSGKEDEHSPVGIKPASLADNGLTLSGDFDLADLSGKSSQTVSARVLSEEVID